MRLMAALALVLGLTIAPQADVSARKRIALSFDDVPRHAGAFFTPDQRTTELIAALERGGVDQAGFFVTIGNLQLAGGVGGEARIAAYVAAGHVLGNHSSTHPWLSRSEVHEYLADIDSAEAWLRDRPGRRAWFRFPYLDEGGRDIDKRDAIRAGLRTRGLRNAYVTVDNYDWHLDALASRARRQVRTMNMDALGDLYVETLTQAVDFYDRIATQTLDRSPIHVLLLHETDLAALFVDDLAKALGRGGWEIVSIDEAYSDPIAGLDPDTWFLGSGRVAAVAHTEGWAPEDLIHERTDEAVLERLFAERVLGEVGWEHAAKRRDPGM